MKKFLSLSILFLTAFLFNITYAKEMPKTYVKLIVNGKEYKKGDKINARAGEELNVEAKVFGGRRAWCMQPEKYANMGKNTKIIANNETGLIFTTGAGFKGTWTLKSESAKWLGSLGSYLKEGKDATATIKAPQKTGNYILKVKALAVWDYKRVANGIHKNKTEKSEATASFKIVVGKGSGTWLSTNNITASGDEDKDIRFALNSIQNMYNVIRKQALEKKFKLAKSNLKSLEKSLKRIKKRLNSIKRKNKKFDCKITFIGLPTDDANKRQDVLKKMSKQWRDMYKISSANAQKINELLRKEQTVFTNNILKSVFKNYLSWGSGIPGTNDLFGIVPVSLSAMVLPANCLEWYNQAKDDASILKNQARSIKMMSELREYYLQRSKAYSGEKKKIKADMDKSRPLKSLTNSAKAIMNSSKSWAKVVSKS